MKTKKSIFDIAARRTFGAKIDEVFALITDEQVLAILSVVQDVIDGRVEILCKGVDMSAEQVHFIRGGIAALYDVTEQIVATRRTNKPIIEDMQS